MLLVAEIGLGLYQDGLQALPLLLLEVAQLLLFTGLMWGGGDLAYLVIETNHDIRASRVLLWQLNMLRQMEMQQKGLHVDPIDPENPLGTNAGRGARRPRPGTLGKLCTRCTA